MDKHYHERDGCFIERAENRGITIKQLLFVVQEMEVLYNQEKEFWMKNGRKSFDKITIYDSYDKIIKPRTEKKKVSYVEIVASEEQRPMWCVCFIWSQPLKDMVDILLKHSKDRDMRDSDSYWINVSYFILL